MRPMLFDVPGGPKRRSLAGGEALFRQGDPAVAIYRVEHGKLRLERRTYDGRLVTIHSAKAGEFFAEASLFSDAYHCDAIAQEPSRVSIYPKTAVLEALREDPESAASFLALMARQLQAVRLRLELRNVRSARQRVLLHLELRTEADGRTVRLPGQLQDLAAELGLTREALYRTLASLEREGRIERSGPCILLKRPLGA